jgi:hypothetical protein
MKPALPILLLQLAASIESGSAQTVYFNDFSSPDSIQDFTIVGESFVGYTPPPLHTVSLQDARLRIDTTVLFPNGPGTSPALFGSAVLMRSNGDFGSGFTSVLSQNADVISWTFNVANQDGSFNNQFDFILGSTLQDPTSIAAQGYLFHGGGMVGDRMILSRFNHGTGGGQNIIIDVAEGLGTMPQMGSFRITYDPFIDEWKLYGAMGSAFENPMMVSTFLGSGVDSAYANQALPFFGFGGGTTGVDIFDNVGVTIIPEPSGLALILAASVLGLLLVKRSRNATSRPAPEAV